MIQVKNISKKYGDKAVLEHFSYSFLEQGVVAVTGPSGIGKTTLLNLLLGLEKPDEGTIEIPAGTTFSAVFQEDRLLEKETALENAAIFYEGKTDGSVSLSIQGKETAKQILSELGLADDLNTPARDLSGGMARRVAIARGLVAMTGPLGAKVCIMDEPIKGLDPENRKQTMDVIRKYCAGKLLIMVTHDENDAEGADEILSF